MPGNAPSELQIQLAFRSRCKAICPGVMIVAVPNGGRRTQWEQNQVKREGIAKGFPDLMAIAPGKIAFLEFKSAKGRIKPDQVEWHDRLARWGFPVGVFRDADAAVEFLREKGFPFIDRVGRL